MSEKIRTFFPKYQLRARDRDFCSKKALVFRNREGASFLTTIPLFGITETQKVILEWLKRHEAPPVISVSHGKLTAPDRGSFPQADELHRWYFPYAMAVAMAHCLGETVPRTLKVYFCNVELHESAAFNRVATHSRSKETFVAAATTS